MNKLASKKDYIVVLLLFPRYETCNCRYYAKIRTRFYNLKLSSNQDYNLNSTNSKLWFNKGQL